MSGTDDLLSMADVARMTGQSRSTVGNWKARNANFPVPASRTNRGPLYDREDIEDWLRRTGRLTEDLVDGASAAKSAPVGASPEVEHVDVALVFLALRKFCDAAQWSKVVDLAETREIDEIDKVVQTVIPFADGLIDWHEQNLAGADLRTIVKRVSRLDPGDIAKTVEELLHRCSASESRTLRTSQPAFHHPVAVPPVVRDLMVALVNAADDDEAQSGDTSPGTDVIYQAGPGLGQVIVQMAGIERPFAGEFYLQEPTRQGACIAGANLAVHGLTAKTASGDLFAEDAFRELRAARVICTPPWDPKVPNLTDTADDPRWVWGEPGTNDAYLAWVQHCLYHLADGGRAVILLPSTVLVDRGRSTRMRRRIVKAGLLEGVISLPAGAIPGKSIRGTLLVFSKSRKPLEGTAMVDLSIPADGPGISNVILTPALIKQTIDAYGLAGRMPTESVNTEYAYLEDIAANDFVLDPARYQTITGPIDSQEQLSYRYFTLRYRLETLLAASSQADERLRTVLELGS